MLGEFLVSKKLVTFEQVKEALDVQPISKKKLGRILVELGSMTQHNCDTALAEYLHIVFEQSVVPIVSDKTLQSRIRTIETDKAKGYLVPTVPVKLYLKQFNDELAERAESIENQFEIRLVTYEQWDFLQTVIGSEGKKSTKTLVELEEIKVQSTPTTPYRDLLVSLLKKAKENQASDVHFDSTREGLIVRFRINGDLSIVKTLKHEYTQSFLTEVKSQTGLPLTVIGSPCSGAARFPEMKLKVRAQSNGQIYGETIVLRLIDEEKTKYASIKTIGADSLFEAEIQKAMSFSSGLILMCGQTGSGKSMTLYSVLMDLDRQTSKIITIEDPVEYEGAGLMQIEVSDGKVSFKDALRSSLRLDPDVIMVGEIRDEETAELAFKAASTGHLVFSTLHTNGAIEALSRLKGLGIPEDVIESNVRMISALTLRKRLCENCKVLLGVNAITSLSENAESMTHSGVHFFTRNTNGCSSCHHGAIGRILLYESITQDQIKEFREGLMVPGFRSLRQFALERAAQGIIGIEEALNV